MDVYSAHTLATGPPQPTLASAGGPESGTLGVGLPEGAAADPATEQDHSGLRAGLPGPWHTVGAWEMFVEMKLKCRKRELKEL